MQHLLLCYHLASISLAVPPYLVPNSQYLPSNPPPPTVHICKKPSRVCAALILTCCTIEALPSRQQQPQKQTRARSRTREKGIFKILIDRRRHGKLSESFAFKGVRFVVVVVVVDALLLLYVRNGAHQPIDGRLEEGGRKNDVSRFSEFSSALSSAWFHRTWSVAHHPLKLRRWRGGGVAWHRDPEHPKTRAAAHYLWNKRSSLF